MSAPCVTAPPLLLPALIARRPQRDPRLDESYPDAQAVVLLSRDFAAGLCLGEAPLTHDAIARLGLSLHRAWDRTAAGLLTAAQSERGTRFRTRAATALHPGFRGQPVWQVDCPGAPAASWLAHPYPFTVLHRHLTSLGRGQEPWYYAPRPDLLLAAPRGYRADVSFVPARISSLPIAYRHGFPTLLGARV